MKTYNQLKTEIIMDFYVDEICEFLGTRKADISKKLKDRELADIRAMVCYLTKSQFPKFKLKDMADFFKQNHSTVLHSLNKIEDLMKYDDKIKNTIGFIQLQDFENAILLRNGFKRLGDSIYYIMTPSTMFDVYLLQGENYSCNILYHEHFYIDKVDIFDAIIISQNINSNPLEFLIHSLKN